MRKIRINFQMSEREALLLHEVSDATGVPSSELLRRGFVFYIAKYWIYNMGVKKAFLKFSKGKK